MRQLQRTGQIADAKFATALEDAHERTATDEISTAALESFLDQSLPSAETVSVTTVAATDNVGRPKSILMGDCRIDEEKRVFEVLCTEDFTVASENITKHDDGTQSFVIGEAKTDVSYRYDSVELVLYEE